MTNPTLVQIESKLEMAGVSIVGAWPRLHNGTLGRAVQHLQAAKTELDEAILDVDGLRLDLLMEQEEIRHDSHSVEGWERRLLDAIEGEPTDPGFEAWVKRNGGI